MINVCLRGRPAILKAKYVEIKKNGEAVIFLTDGTEKVMEATEIKFITNAEENDREVVPLFG